MTSPSLHQPSIQNCPECETPLAGKYCHACGEKLPDQHDLSLKHFIGHGVHELTHFDSKTFRTLKMLVFAPGGLTADYLAGRRKRYVQPLRLFLVVFAINLFLYTRPGITLYDIQFVIGPSGQAGVLDKKMERKAEEKHISKEAVYEQLNEHWQHDISLLQLGDALFFALFLAIVNRRRYFVEHLIFSLHTLSFSFLYGCAMWLYYVRFGFRQNIPLFIIFAVVLLFYLWRALPKVYATSGRGTLLRAVFLVAALEIVRSFFMSFTLIVAMMQTFGIHSLVSVSNGPVR